MKQRPKEQEDKYWRKEGEFLYCKFNSDNKKHTDHLEAENKGYKEREVLASDLVIELLTKVSDLEAENKALKDENEGLIEVNKAINLLVGSKKDIINLLKGSVKELLEGVKELNGEFQEGWDDEIEIAEKLLGK